MPESGAGPKVGPTLQSYMAPRRLVGARFSATRWNEFFGFSIEDFRNPVIYIPPACLRASAGQQHHDPHPERNQICNPGMALETESSDLLPCRPAPRQAGRQVPQGCQIDGGRHRAGGRASVARSDAVAVPLAGDHVLDCESTDLPVRRCGV